MFHSTQLNALTRNDLKDYKDLTYAQQSTNNWYWSSWITVLLAQVTQAYSDQD